MGQLNNLYVSSSYQGLLKMTDSTNGLTNTLQTVQTGDGDNSPLQMSLTQVNISGSFSVNGIVITGGTSGSSGSSGTSGTSGSSGSSGTSGSSGSGFTFSGPWTSTTTYNLNDVVTYGGQSYVSIQAGNLNKQPSVQPSWWTVFSAAGSSGTSGTSGTSGSSGSSGTSGSSGSSGTSGSSGSSGTSGTSGSSGSSGTSGTSGSSGSSGTSGTSGSSGSSGTSGTSGSSGSSGTSGTAGTSGDSIFALTGSIWETSVQTKFNADSTFGADLTVLQDINLPTGSAIKLSPDPGGNSAAIRFLSGSNPASNRWLNIQGVPTSPAGDVAISDFPSNNHFMFFEMSGHTIQIEAPLRSTGSAPILIQNGIINNTNYSPVIPGIGLINSGSLTNRGDVEIISNNTTVDIDLYLTSSLLGQSNIIKGWSDNQSTSGVGAVQANYTGSLRITGSNNIVSMPQLRATGNSGGVDQQGYISGSDNTLASNGGGIYLNTGSLIFPKTTNNYIGASSYLSMNFTTSSIAGGHPNIQNNTLYGGSITINSNSGSLTSLSVNLINGGSISSTQNFVTNARPSIATNVIVGSVTLNHISSSINYLANINNAPVTINNHLSSSNITNNNVSFGNNTFLGGQGSTGPSIFVSGSQSSNLTRNFNSNLIGGTRPIISSSFVSSSNSNLLSTIMYGNSLRVSASHTVSTFGGSAFFGRFNMTGSNLEDAQSVVFAVGTGTAEGSRRTGFLIDSGSNTSISGSLNVNGNTTITGSLAVTGNVQFASGSNTTMGTVALNGANPGTATVSNTLVTANSLIYLTKQTNNHPNAGPVVVSSKGSSTFTITSNHNGDTDTVAYLIINPS